MGLWISSFWMDLAENALWNRPGSSTEEPSELGRVSRCFVRKSISNGAQYVTLQKYFSHPSLVIYFLSTPTIKLMLGYQIGGGLLIANHLDQSLIRNTEQQVKSYFRTLFSSGVQAAAPFTSHYTLCNYAEPKTFSWIQFYCAGSNTEHCSRCSNRETSPVVVQGKTPKNLNLHKRKTST
jgi:hypothetical protein